jgi:hypothetical protein
MSAFTAVEAFLTRLRDGWQARSELASLDRSELDRIAGDFGMSANDLETLVERGPDAAHLLYERLNALGIAKEDIESAAFGVMQDLEKTCALCNEKGLCQKDLTSRPGDPGWRSYCPNAITLDSLKRLTCNT